jgi:uncharacterized protein YlxW (UPF0749 family)
MLPPHPRDIFAARRGVVPATILRARKSSETKTYHQRHNMTSGFFAEMIKEAFAKVESEEVTRKRRMEEDNAKMGLEDLPEFAQKTLLQLQAELNQLQKKVDTQQFEVKRAKLVEEAVIAKNKHLHQTIAVLGQQRLSQ